MRLFGFEIRRQKAAPASAGYGYAAMPLGSPYTDLFQKTRSASPFQLIQQIVGVAYACVYLNANAVASTPLRLYVRTRRGQRQTRWISEPVSIRQRSILEASGKAQSGTDVREIVDRAHPLLALLSDPNPGDSGLSGREFLRMTQIYLDSIGRAYWLPSLDGLSVPREIWLLRSHLVRETRSGDEEMQGLRFEYGTDRYNAEDLIKLHNSDPFDPYIGGFSPLQAALEKILVARKGDAHMNALLDNMGRPDSIFVPKGDSEGQALSESEAKRIRESLRRTFAMAGRGGVMIAESPGTLSPLTWPTQDIVEIERAKAIKTDVCNCFDIPDALLERNAANLASAKTAEYSHAKHGILPRLHLMEAAINSRLVPMFDPDQRLFVQFDSPLPDDQLFELEQHKAGTQSGAITRNEFRKTVGLEPVPWGDSPVLPKGTIAANPVTGQPIPRPSQPDSEDPTNGEEASNR